MCRVDGGDDFSCSVYREKTVKTRKVHKCEECNREIAVGEMADYHFGIFDGDAIAVYICQHCCVGVAWLRRNCGGWLFGAVTEDVDEHVVEYPKLAVPLAAYVTGARSKWVQGGVAMAVMQEMPSIEWSLVE